VGEGTHARAGDWATRRGGGLSMGTRRVAVKRYAAAWTSFRNRVPERCSHQKGSCAEVSTRKGLKTMKTRTRTMTQLYSMLILLVVACGFSVNAFADCSYCGNQRYLVSSTGQPNPDEGSGSGWQSPYYYQNGGVGAAVSYASMDSLYQASCPIHSGYDNLVVAWSCRVNPITVDVTVTVYGSGGVGLASVTNVLVAPYPLPAYTNGTDCNGNSTGDPWYNDYSGQC